LYFDKRRAHTALAAVNETTNIMTKMKPQAEDRRAFLRRSALVAGVFFIVPRWVIAGRGYVMPSDKINLGVIGCGRQAPYLSRRFCELAASQVLAVCDVYAAKRERLQHQVDAHYAAAKEQVDYRGCVAYEDYVELLARPDIDGVIVALPDHWHAQASIDAMKAGKDVFCEKPLTPTVQEGRAMVDAARKYGRVVQTGSMQRSWENFRHACELVRNGYLGELKRVLVNVGDPAVPYNLPEEPLPDGLNWDRWIGPAKYVPFNPELAPAPPETIWPRWRDFSEFAGGILADWGAHMFDIAQWALDMDNSGPVEFIPPTDPGAKRGLRMIYANGVEMVHEDFGRGWAVRFIGEKGSLDISRGFLDSNPEEIVKHPIGENERRLYRSDDHYQDWLNCVKNRQMPICDVETGHRSASVCNLANIAYWLNRPLRWDPVRERFIGDGKANKLLGKKYRKGYSLKLA
jgi:predicted dehydrogenase